MKQLASAIGRMAYRRARLATILPAVLLAACGTSESEGVPGDSSDTQPFAEIAATDILRLTGTEPFWGGRIEGNTLSWSTPELPDGVSVPVTRFPGRGGVSFSGQLDGAPLDILVTPAECSDGMSDRIYPYVATVQTGSETREGCAWRENVDEMGEP